MTVTGRDAPSPIRALFLRDLLLARAYPVAFALSIAGTVLTLLLFLGISGFVSADGATAAEPLAPYSGRYFPFVALGIAFSLLAQACLSAAPDAVRREQVEGGLVPLVATASPAVRIVFGLSVFSIASAAGFLVLSLVSAQVLGAGFETVRPWPVLAATILTAAGNFGISLLSTAFVLLYKRGDPVSYALVMVTDLVSGVYFPVEWLPGPVRVAAAWLPQTLGLSLFRSGFSPSAARAEGTTLLLLLAVSGIALALGLAVFALALARARRTGALMTL